MDLLQRGVASALSLLLVLSLSTTAEAQSKVLSHPYEANTWHTLPCEREQWQCSWEVQRNGPSGSFQPVELGTQFVKAAASLPGDLDIFLNEITKGIYRCSCRRDGGQTAEIRTEVYFYSEGKGCIGRHAGKRGYFRLCSSLDSPFLTADF